MSVVLREYQNRDVENIRAAFKNGSRAPLWVSPTGSGKTVVFSYIAKTAQTRGKRVLILVHRIELLRQTARKLLQYNVRHGLINPNYSGDLTQSVQVASVQTFVRRLHKTRLDYDLVIIDEAHHATAGTWKTSLKALSENSKRLTILGVTATPMRTDGQGLGVASGGIFDQLIEGATMRELIDLGFLVEPIIYAPPNKLDLTEVKMRGGDYASDDLFVVMDKPQITGDAIAHYRQICNGVPGLAFCVNVAHAEHVAAEFRAAGYCSYSIDGSMGDDERKQLLKGFESGHIKVLTSCDLVSEGTDIPAIGCLFLLRPTKSLVLYMQQVGRSLRPFAGKDNAIIFDHVGNVMTHGFPDEKRNWSLAGDQRRKKGQREFSDELIIKTRLCPQCYAVHKILPKCPHCNHIYEVSQELPEVVDGQLTILTKEDKDRLTFLKRREIGNAQTLEDLIAIEAARGYKAGWANHIWEARQIKKGKNEIGI